MMALRAPSARLDSVFRVQHDYNKTLYAAILVRARITTLRHWLDYVPLPKEAFVDNWSSVYDQYWRPAELEATRQARGNIPPPVPPRLEPPGWATRRCCIRCGQHKDESQFDRDTRTPSGLAFACKTCRRERRLGLDKGLPKGQAVGKRRVKQTKHKHRKS